MKGVIFDFNGTMVFDGVYHALAWTTFSKQIRGVALCEEECRLHVHGKVNKEIIEYLKPGIDADENRRLSLEKEAVYRAQCMDDKDNYTLVKGLISFMDYLKKESIPFTIASASIKDNINFFVDTFHLEEWIDIDTIVYDDGTYKDKVDMFIDAAHNIGVPLEQCVVFEDSATGIRCAHEAGVLAIVAIPDEQRRNECMNNKDIALVIEDFTDERIREVCR